jgi:exodeoxyribonuclease V gamma subunit
MLSIHHSNRFEILRERLLGALDAAPGDVFAREQVVVPSSAIRSELTRAIADRRGVCAGIDFLFLARWLWLQAAKVLPGVSAESPYEPASLVWRIHAAFGDEAFTRAHPRLQRYLDSADDVMRFELARSVAGLVDQSITYRPDWLDHWQQPGARPVTSSPDEAWQAALWRRLSDEIGIRGRHPFSQLVEQLEAATTGFAREKGLAPVSHVFCPPAMPPLHLQALCALGRCTDVHLYVLNPCQEHWFDDVDPRNVRRLEQAAAEDSPFGVASNRLLVSWAGPSQAMLRLLEGISDTELAQTERTFHEPEGGTLLARLQRAILQGEELEPGTPLAAADRSLEIHVAHSLTRQFEVLHDQLLGLFAADATLRPSDVLVVAPDLDKAAPQIDAVFGTAPRERSIPYAISGRAQQADPVVRTFTSLLALVRSRCTATEVYGLLQAPPVARRFGLAEQDLEQVHAWLLASGTHWGLDEAHVAAQQLPQVARHTFAAGLERLFLGYALPDAAAQPFAGVLPRGEAEGSAAAALGATWSFLRELRRLRAAVQNRRSLRGWVDLLRGALDTLLEPADDEIESLSELHAVLDAAADGAPAGTADDLPFAVAVAAIEEALAQSARGGVATGRVTFASISSLRAVPFRVVCVVGLDDGAFPGDQRHPEYDLLAAAPRLGDRQRRSDQRNLFLDLLLAARDRVLLAYTGRSIRDNSPLPPSVLVSELLDAVLPALADPDAARKQIVVEHPLQPFAPACFSAASDPRVRSHDAELAQALQRSLAAQAAALQQLAASGDAGGADDDADDDEAGTGYAVPFFTKGLPVPGAEWRDVSVQQLVDFFRNPSRFLLRKRLRLDLAQDDPELQDDEPFTPDFLDGSALADRLLPFFLQGATPDDVRPLALAGTEMPVGPIGHAAIEQALHGMHAFAGQVRRLTATAVLPPHAASLELKIDGEAWRLDAAFADLRPAGLVRWRYDDERATDVLQGWLLHLALCAAPAPGVLARTTWVARDGIRRFEPLARDQAAGQLSSLLRLYRQGLQRPLDFFPKAAWALVRDDDEAAARRTWQGSFMGPGENAKPGYGLAYRGAADPITGTAFADNAGIVFGPVRQASSVQAAEEQG